MSESRRDNQALRARLQRCESASRLAHTQLDVLRRRLAQNLAIPFEELQELAEQIAQIRLLLAGQGGAQ